MGARTGLIRPLTLVAFPDGAELDHLAAARCILILFPEATLIHPKRLAQNAWDLARRANWFSSIRLCAIDWKNVGVVHLLGITQPRHNPELSELLTRFEGEIDSYFSGDSGSLPFKVQEYRHSSQSLTAYFVNKIFRETNGFPKVRDACMPREPGRAEAATMGNIPQKGQEEQAAFRSITYLLNNQGEPIKANRRAHGDRPQGMRHANSLRMAKGGACPPFLSRYSITNEDAELMFMAIMERTGACLSARISEDDIAALNKLRNFHISIRHVSNQVILGFREGHQGLLKDLLKNIEDCEVNNRLFMFSVVRSLGNVQELLPIMDTMWSREGPELLIAAVCYQGRAHVWARGKLVQDDLVRCFARYRPLVKHRWIVFSIREGEPLAVRKILMQDLLLGLKPEKTVAEIMIAPPKCVDYQSTVSDTLDKMLRFNQMWFVVTRDGSFAGMICRLDLDRAVRMEFLDSAIGQFISSNFPFVSIDTPIRVARQLMIRHNIDQLPVIDQGNPMGVITTREILHAFHDHVPLPKRFLPLVTMADLPDSERIASLVKRVVSLRIFHVLKRIGEAAQKASVQAYLVGGFVRDLLLERSNLDIDVVIIGDALPFAVQASQELKAEIQTFDRFHTARLKFDDIKIDFSSARIEHYAAVGALPEVEISGLFHDLARRDFSINALALDLSPERYLQLVDFFGGYQDLLQHHLRILHSFSFIEDPTRIYRAIRFAVRFHFGFAKDTISALHIAVDRGVVEKLSLRRIYSEISLCFLEESPWRVIEQLFKFGLFRPLHKDLADASALPVRFKLIPGIIRRFGVLGEPIDIKTVHWIGLLMQIPPDEVDAFLKRVGCPVGCRKIIVESITALISIPPKLVRLKSHDDEALYELLAGLSIESLVSLVAFSLDKNGVSLVFEFLTRLRSIKLEISGKDLLTIGIPSGVNIGCILREALKEKVRGRLISRKEELEYAQRLFESLSLSKSE